MLKLYAESPDTCQYSLLLDGNWVINGAFEVEFFEGGKVAKCHRKHKISGSHAAYFVMNVPNKIVKKYGKGDYNNIISACEKIVLKRKTK